MQLTTRDLKKLIRSVIEESSTMINTLGLSPAQVKTIYSGNRKVTQKQKPSNNANYIQINKTELGKLDSMKRNKDLYVIGLNIKTNDAYLLSSSPESVFEDLGVQLDIINENGQPLKSRTIKQYASYNRALRQITGRSISYFYTTDLVKNDIRKSRSKGRSDSGKDVGEVPKQYLSLINKHIRPLIDKANTAIQEGRLENIEDIIDLDNDTITMSNIIESVSDSEFSDLRYTIEPTLIDMIATKVSRFQIPSIGYYDVMNTQIGNASDTKIKLITVQFIKDAKKVINLILDNII